MKKKNLRICSSAKINLFLDVLSKRSDGYHQIRTIFSEIGLADILNFALTKKGTVKILSDKDFVSTKENLIYKVSIFIKERYNVKFGVEINLQKNIPISAGMGGEAVMQPVRSLHFQSYGTSNFPKRKCMI